MSKKYKKRDLQSHRVWQDTETGGIYHQIGIALRWGGNAEVTADWLVMAFNITDQYHRAVSIPEFLDGRFEPVQPPEPDVKHADVDINDMTPELWNSMTKTERHVWTRHWSKQGIVSFCCVLCGFPTAFGQAGCEACQPTAKEKA